VGSEREVGTAVGVELEAGTAAGSGLEAGTVAESELEAGSAVLASMVMWDSFFVDGLRLRIPNSLLAWSQWSPSWV
jgi:hypothetical protein